MFCTNAPLDAPQPASEYQQQQQRPDQHRGPARERPACSQTSGTSWYQVHPFPAPSSPPPVVLDDRVVGWWMIIFPHVWDLLDAEGLLSICVGWSCEFWFPISPGQSFPNLAGRRVRSRRSRRGKRRRGRSREGHREVVTRPTATPAPSVAIVARGAAAGRNARERKARSSPWSWMAGSAHGHNTSHPNLTRLESRGLRRRARDLRPQVRLLTPNNPQHSHLKRTSTGTTRPSCSQTHIWQPCSSNNIINSIIKVSNSQ